MRNFFAHLFTIVFLIFALFISACGPLYEPIDITGKVIDSSDRQPISEALVKIIAPSEFSAETFSDESGNFLFEEVSVDTTINISIEVSKEGFNTQTVTVDATPENDISVPNIEISSSDPDQGDDEPDSKGSANITLLSKSASSIQVKSTGGNETATFEFVVKDSTGTPVNTQNAATVNFEITAGPDGGEALFPLSAVTESGIAKTTLNSGTKAGVVQIRASFERNGNIERSEPVPITIQGGLPNENHFEVRTESKNIPTATASETEISVLIGDIYGNVVTIGTAIYFSTNKGNIDGSAETDDSGRASVLLRTNSTSPGTANVSVSTIGDENNEIERELEIIFSGDPEISVTPENIDLLGFESQNFTVNLSDVNGNPLSAGTTLNINVDNEDLVLNGATSVELTDTQRKGIGYTEFEFQLRNPDKVTINEDVTLSIQTNGPNGSEIKNLTFEVDKPAPEKAGSIFLEEISLTDIGVRSTGQREDTQLTFQVVDVNGNPLSNSNPVDVDFKFGDRPGGDEFLSPQKVQTNNLGQATVTLTSGTEAGTVQVVAFVDTGDREIESEPVSVVINAGLPSERYFSIVPAQINFPATLFGEQYEFLVLAGDRYSNTVPDGVAIYFETNGGFIDGSALTAGGRATALLTMGNPIPNDGRVRVRAYSSDDNRNEIDDRTDVLFSRQPIITTDTNSINLSNGGDLTINYEVKDINDLPMVEGTTISVSAEGEEIELIGDTEITLRDVNPDFSNIEDLTEFRFNVKDADEDNNEDSPVIITIEVDGPNGYAKKVIEGRKSKEF